MYPIFPRQSPEDPFGNKEYKLKIVKDEKLRSSVCENIRLWIEDKMSWKVIQIIKSPITGPKGNVEYLLYASK